MKTTRGLSFVLLVSVLFFAVAAKADTVNVTLTGVSGGIQGNVYTSPYFATVGSSTNVVIVCDDYTHEVYTGESWVASVYTFADLSHVRFWQGSQASTLKLYDEAAYLFEELFSQPSQSGDISFALWAVFSPAAVESSAGWTANAASWLANAQGQTYSTGEFSDFQILTPYSSTSPQEYLVRTPEPSTILLLFVGLFAILAFKSRKSLRGAAV
jgi:hypothetical protein